MTASDSQDPTATPGRPAQKRASARLPAIDGRRCTGCGWCVAACELHLLSLETERWKKSAVLHDAALCTGCAHCAVKCPFTAITMRRADAGAITPAT